MPREIKFEAPAHEQIILVMEMSFFFGIFFLLVVGVKWESDSMGSSAKQTKHNVKLNLLVLE